MEITKIKGRKKATIENLLKVNQGKIIQVFQMNILFKLFYNHKMRMMFSLMLISFCTLLPCLIPQSQLQCPGSTLGKSHWPIKSNISHSLHIYHFVQQLFIWPGLSYSQTYFFRQRKTIRDLKLVFSPYKCTSVLCWKIHFHSLCLKNLSSGIFFF